MAQNRNREEVINTQLAILVSKLGVTADAEIIYVHGKHRPDALFELRGLRVVVEGNFSDHPGAESVVLEDVQKSVRTLALLNACRCRRAAASIQCNRLSEP